MLFWEDKMYRAKNILQTKVIFQFLLKFTVKCIRNLIYQEISILPTKLCSNHEYFHLY